MRSGWPILLAGVGVISLFLATGCEGGQAPPAASQPSGGAATSVREAPVVAAQSQPAKDLPPFNVPSPDISKLPEPVQESIREVRSAYEKDPSDAKTLVSLGAFYFVHGFERDALACFERARALAPSDFRFEYVVGLARKAVDDAAGAREAFSQAIVQNDRYIPSYLQLAKLYGPDDHDQMRSIYERVVTLDPLNPFANLWLGRDDMKQGRNDAALERFMAATRGSVNFADAHLALAELYEKLDRKEEAQQQRGVAASLPELPEPPDPILDLIEQEGLKMESLVARGAALIDRDNPAGALQALDLALELDPNFAPAHFWRANALFRQGKLDEAAGEFHKLIELDPNNVSGYSELGAVLVAQGKETEGLEQFSKALDIDPSDMLTLRRYLVLMQKLDRQKEALERLRKIAASQPENAQLRYQFGVALGDLNLLPEAIEFINSGLEIGPPDPRALTFLGDLHYRRGEKDQARDAWQRAIEAADQYFDARIRLSELDFEQLKFKAALDRLVDGLNKYPDSVPLLDTLARMLVTASDFRFRNVDEALKRINHAVEVTQGRAYQILGTKALVQEAGGDFAGAAETLQKAAQVAQQAGAERAAQAYAQRAAADQAEVNRRAAASQPSDAPAGPQQP